MNTSPIITLSWIRSQKAKLKARLADLEAAERLLLGQAPELPLGEPEHQPLETKGYGSKKRILLTVIADSHGLTTQGVIEAGSAAGLAGLRTENVSPLLSGYKGDGLLTLEMGLWKITPKGHDLLASGKIKGSGHER